MSGKYSLIASVILILFVDDNASSADRIALINTGFDAFAAIAAACEASRAMEYRTVAVALYHGLCANFWHDTKLIPL